MVQVIFFFFISIQGGFAAEEVASQGDELPFCANHKTDLTERDVEALLNYRLFPGPFDSIGEFTRKIDLNEIAKHNRPHNHNRCASILTPYHHEPSGRLLETFKKLSDETTRLIVEQIEGQKNLIDMAEFCAGHIATLMSYSEKNLSQLTLADFDFLKKNTPSDEDCFGFANMYMPSLSEKLSDMRIYLALSIDSNQKEGRNGSGFGQLVEHDISFSQELGSNFFPSVWPKNGVKKLQPLSIEELQKARVLGRTTSPAQALSKYYSLVSNNPILFFFNDSVSPRLLHDAVTKIKGQTSKDLAEVAQEGPRDMMLMLSFVEAAFKKLPDESKGDACLILKKINKNIHHRYGVFPQQIAQLGVALSIVGGAYGRSVKEAIAITSKGLGVTSVIYGGTMSYDNLKKYLSSVEKCKSVVTENNLCNVKLINKAYQDTEFNTTVSILSGATFFGIARLFRPATK